MQSGVHFHIFEANLNLYYCLFLLKYYMYQKYNSVSTLCYALTESCFM